MTQFAAILLSRQPLRPNGQTAWVKQVVAAMAWLKDNKCGLISSTGMQTWELITALASMKKLPVQVFVPLTDSHEFASECDSLIYQYELDPDLTEFVPVYGSERAPNPASLMSRRDRLIVKQADLLVPVSIREDGGMANLVSVARAFGRQITREFEIDHEDRVGSLAEVFSDYPINPELENTRYEYLVHWTRATNSPWPDERQIDFYKDVLASSAWPRSGLETLRRIVRQRRVISSFRHMPAGVATVSFSSLPPVEVIPLMKWRARYRQMSFEPYGIAISRGAAEGGGVRPVEYVEPPDDPAGGEERWRRQTRGRITDWRQEKEYRIRGDFAFGGIPPDQIVLYCKSPQEADLLRSECPYRVIPLFTSCDNST